VNLSLLARYWPDQAVTRDIVRQERLLLIAASVFVILSQFGLMLARGDSILLFWPVIVWLICAAALHVVLTILIPNRDPVLLPIVMMLAGWGLVLIARLAPPFTSRQTTWLVISAVSVVVVAILPPSLRILRRYRYSWLLAGVALLAATLIFGVNPSGEELAPRLWLDFGFVYFQPSEILKLLLVVFLSSYLADKRELILITLIKVGRWQVPSPTYMAPMLVMWGFCMILLVWQRDLGTASLFFIIFLAMLYASTGQAAYGLTGIGLLGLAGIIGYQLYDVVRLRVDTWWNPWPEADDRAFQIVQSLMAVASGGLIGQGVGQGQPTYVPVVHSDFVFAAISEEWGMAGGLAAIACIAVLVLRAFRIAAKLPDHPFHSLLATGIGVAFGVQSLLIMAGVVKLIPLTGVTLPFVSYGGSSLLSSFIMAGLLLRISDPETSYARRTITQLIPRSEIAP
jgi:cell division protein FtsW (lipid II flippase)